MNKKLAPLLLLTFSFFGTPALAASDLKGTTLCLMPDVSTWPTGAGMDALPNRAALAQQLYAEVKTRFRQQGVKFSEDRSCHAKKDAAHPDFFLDVDMGAPLRDGRREAKVGLNVIVSVPGSFQGQYIYSKVTYLYFAPNEEPAARIMTAARTFLANFVQSWRDENR